jgi:hypothetical protein
MLPTEPPLDLTESPPYSSHCAVSWHRCLGDPARAQGEVMYTHVGRCYTTVMAQLKSRPV